MKRSSSAPRQTRTDSGRTVDLEILKKDVADSLDKLRRYEEVLCATDDLMSLLDADFRYISVNAAYSRLHGLAVEEIVGKTPAELHSKEEYEREIRPRLEQCFRGRQVRYQAWFEFPGAGRRYMDVSYIPVYDNKDSISSAAVLVRDITELRHYVDLLDEKNEELQRICAEKNKLFSIIAHDLRAPLFSLQTFLDIIDTDTFTLEDIRRFSEGFKSSLRRTGTLMEELLQWSKTHINGIEPRFSAFSMRKLAAEKIRQLEHMSSLKNIRLLNEVREHDHAWGEREMIAIVLYNLLLNAIKFTPEGGTVSVASNTSESGVEFSVSDEGAGIPPEILPGLFEAGQLITRPGTENEQGKGLGLIFCKELVTYNNGTIRAENKPGRGSRFSITLPRGPEGDA